MTTYQMLTLVLGLMLVAFAVAEYWKPQLHAVL